MRDRGTQDGRKLLWQRRTLFFVSVIGICLVFLCLGNFDTQTDVCMCIVFSRHCKKCAMLWRMRDKGTLDGIKLLGQRGTLLFVSVIGFCVLLLIWKMLDKGTMHGRKLLGRRGTLLFVSVIGFCLVGLCLCNFDAQTDVCMCMENARQGNTGWKKFTLAEGNPPLGLCDWILSFFT